MKCYENNKKQQKTKNNRKHKTKQQQQKQTNKKHGHFYLQRSTNSNLPNNEIDNYFNLMTIPNLGSVRKLQTAVLPSRQEHYI